MTQDTGRAELERMQARIEELSLSEARLRLLVDGVKGHAFFMLDPEGRVASWNLGAERLKGYRAAEIVGQPCSRFYVGDEAIDGTPGRALAVARAEGRSETEGWRVRKDGTRFWANVVYSAVHDEAGSLIGFTEATRDFSDRRTAEAKFRGLLESAPDALVIFDEAGTVVLVNAQTERLYGYDRDAILGKSVLRLFPERLHDWKKDRWQRLAGNEKHEIVVSRLELFGLRKDGTEFPVEITASPLVTEDGLLIVNSMRDITDRKQLEVSLQHANRELEAFSYSVAHDLRAPLRGMNGFAQILLEDYGDKLDADGLDCLQEIHGNALRMGELIDKLLHLSRVTRGGGGPLAVDLTALAREVTHRLALENPGRPVEVVIADGLCTEADPALARALLENLLGNAWKFTGKVAAPRIEFGSTVTGGVPTFFVKDNGAGFDMAFSSKLFGPFQRLHTVGEFPGTGIGLATSQRIVHRHGGRIWAEGAVEAGATFFFTLPRHAAGATS